MLRLRPPLAAGLQIESPPGSKPRRKMGDERRIDLGPNDRRHVVVVDGEDAAGPEDPHGLGQHRERLHPVERLRAGHQVCRARREARVGRERLDVADVRRLGDELRRSTIRGFGSTPTTSSACSAQTRVERPVPLPRSTTSLGLSTWATWSRTSTRAAGGEGRLRRKSLGEAFAFVSRTLDQRA